MRLIQAKLSLMVAVTFIICGCRTVTNEGSTETNPKPNNVAYTGPMRLCLVDLRLQLPNNWKVRYTDGTILAHTDKGQEFELKPLSRPTTQPIAESVTAEDTLEEFMRLKIAGMSKLKINSVVPYSKFSGVDDYAAASVAIYYEGDGGETDYTIQYLLAECELLYMITIDKKDINVSEVSEDKSILDSIVRTAINVRKLTDGEKSACNPFRSN